MIALKNCFRSVQDIFCKNPSHNSVRERTSDIFFAGTANFYPLLHSAIVFKDDHVVSNVKETAREIARARGVERSVRKPFARPGRRDEILNRREAFFQR